MPNVELNLSSKIFAPYALPYIQDYSKRWEFWYGGAGSAKSYSITQKLIIRCCSEQIKILVCRRYGSTIRNTVFSLFKDILRKWNILQYVKVREADFNIKFPNGSEIIFTGLDEETKLLSLNGIGTVWIEEAFECGKDIVEQLNLRMRSKNDGQQIIMSWNPIAKTHWLYDFVVTNPPIDSRTIFSTFKDNPFLSKEYIAALEDMKDRDPAKARIYYYGEWGLNPEGLVIKNWRSEAFDGMALARQGLEHRCGCDLGFSDPSAVIETFYDKKNKIIYVCNEYFKRGVQLSDIVQGIREMNLSKSTIMVDSAEPRSIQFFRENNINAKPCNKGKDSIKLGLMFLQDHLIIVHPRCVHFIEELENFSYVKSKQTGEWTDDTTHEWSHAIDACRYAYSDLYATHTIKSLSMSALGL